VRAPDKLFAYVHIPKTAGTTLNHLLRRNFFMRYLDVRPFSTASAGVFRARDLRLSLRLNPSLQCISGHAVRACSDLETLVPDIRYFTLVRDPLRRFVSAYLYRVDVMKREMSFQEFLAAESNWNLQTRLIAGRPDVDAAKEMLARRFWLVGRCEEFAEFVVLFAGKLRPAAFDPCYENQNIAERRGGDKATLARQLIEEHRDAIVSRNELDIELVEHVKREVLPPQRAAYGPGFAEDLRAFKESLGRARPSRMYPYLDYAVRKLYYEPLTGFVRVLNGKRYRGSY
jgi:hypothetical protein